MFGWSIGRRLPLLIAGACLAGAATVFAGAQATPAPAFEVAVVKRSEPKPVVPFQIRPGGHVVATSVTLQSLILRAYGVRFWNLLGAPEWTTRERFDIEATFPEPATPDQVHAMLRTLLERRFRLAAHTESREITTDTLVMSEPGRMGPRMHPVRVDCETKQLLEGSGPGLFPPESRPACGNSIHVALFSITGGAVPSKSQDKLVAFTMERLVDFVSGQRGRQAYNRTGLTGQFDIELTFVSDQNAVLMANAGKSIDAPTFDVALQEQLGIKLRQERNRVAQLVVTSVELPRADEN